MLFWPMLSLVIPTYNEKNNIPTLLEKLFAIFREDGIKAEVIIVDDNSPDGTADVVESMKKKYEGLKLLRRSGKLGLSSAVLDGFAMAKGDILAVMDADMSHPPEAIAKMYKAINTIIPKENKTPDFVIGSRYIKGGGIVGWKTYRKIVSKGATLLARPFTKAHDPMSGLFMIRKKCLLDNDFNAKGFKIGLELLMKANWKIVKEVPYTFRDRMKGKSKAGIKEYYLYLYNLAGYCRYKWTRTVQFIQYGIVGASGTLLNLAILYGLTEFMGLYYLISASIAFVISATHNYIVNKIWTFGEAFVGDSKRKVAKQYGLFFLFSMLALVVNLTALYLFVEWLGVWYIFAQVLAITVAYMVNFTGSKLLVFRR